MHNSQRGSFIHLDAEEDINPRHVGSGSFWSGDEPPQLDENHKQMAAYAWQYFTRTVFLKQDFLKERWAVTRLPWKI